MKRVVTIHDDPMQYFLSRYDADTMPVIASQMKAFFQWLNNRDGWVGVTPKQLLVRQLRAEDPYEIVELIQGFIDSRRNLRKGTLRHNVSVLLEFFRKNRCSLPPDISWKSFTIRSTVAPVQGKLTAKIIRDVVGGLPLRWQSLFLVKYQAFLDTKRLSWLNVNCSEQVTRQLREGRKMIRVDLPCGRKKNAGDRDGMYFTYFGRDAAESLTRYFNEVRGWPSPGQPIWIWTKEDYSVRSRSPNRDKTFPLDRVAVAMKWVRLMRQTNYIPKIKGSGSGRVRYGYNLHEFRDVATTELHVKAKGRGLDMDCVKFWCGQTGQLDPLKYDKFFKEQNYVEKQYALAEPYLNIVSGTPPDEESEKRIQELESKNGELSRGLRMILQKTEEADKLTQKHARVDQEMLRTVEQLQTRFEALEAEHEELLGLYQNELAEKEGLIKPKRNVKK